jgi:hypothetical protein
MRLQTAVRVNTAVTWSEGPRERTGVHDEDIAVGVSVCVCRSAAQAGDGHGAPRCGCCLELLACLKRVKI